ncbi:putative methylxanthine N7-demethylase NdmC [compost metagenome]
MHITSDPVVMNDWFVVAAARSLKAEGLIHTRLLGQDIRVWRDSAGHAHAAPHAGDGQGAAAEYRVQEAYDSIWVSLGKPTRELFDVPEFCQPGRRIINCGAIGVHTSGLRIVENFLDMAHFPFVHTDWLGQEPYTEVKDYKVDVRSDTDEIWATECRFWQPKAAPTASGGMEVEYTYRVMQPFSTMLYKSCPTRPGEFDIIFLLIQPLDEDRCLAHAIFAYFDTTSADAELISFMQLIFGQDKPILENQLPKLIPLDARSEIPTRADAMSIAYRRWLREKGVQYGVQKEAYMPA